MSIRKLLIGTAAVGALVVTVAAQQQSAPPPPPAAQEEIIPDIIVPVQRVVVPVTVTDKNGRLVSGLTPADFLLLDEGVPQPITQDVGYYPISLVVAVQANSTAAQALPTVAKVAPMFDSLVIGETGEMAVLAFDHRIQELSDGFTSNPEQIREAFNMLKPGARAAHQYDAVMQGVRMLKNRPKDRKKVIVVVSETRDFGSEVNVRDVLTEAEFADVEIFAVSMNHFINQITSKAEPNRPNPIPSDARLPLPMGTVQTPTTDAQTNMGNITPIFPEIFALVKGLFIPNAHEVFTKFTGGSEQNFVGLSGLEEAVRSIGEEVHSQYQLTFSPSDKLASGYRRVEVRVFRPDLKVRARAGYWIAPRPN